MLVGGPGSIGLAGGRSGRSFRVVVSGWCRGAVALAVHEKHGQAHDQCHRKEVHLCSFRECVSGLRGKREK